MKEILFIINGPSVDNLDNVSVSGGDMRLFAIMQNWHAGKKFVLTTINGLRLLKKFKVKTQSKFSINYVVKTNIWSNLVIMWKSWWNLPNEVNNYKGTVYSSCEHLYDVLPALKLKWMNGCRWLAVYHNVRDYPWRDLRGNTPWPRRYAYWLNHWLASLLISWWADKILAVSEETHAGLIKIKKINPKRIQTVYCGVDLSEIKEIKNKYRSEKGKKYDGIFLGRLDHAKGVFDLLRIWKLVTKKIKGAKLAIIGSGSKEVIVELNNISKENCLEKNIEFLGPIYNSETKYRLLNSAKVFVFPSHQENWGIVIGEAMAIGLPVVAYDLKSIKKIWGKNISWVGENNIELFAGKIEQYLSNSNKRLKREQKNTIFIEKYDWKKIAKQEFGD